LVLVIVVVLAFKKSENLAAAYGIAVTTTMIVTTFLAAIVMRIVWRWNTFLVALVIGAFLIVDLAFLSANLLKILEGGWFPLLLGAVCFLFLMTWYQGRKILRHNAVNNGIELKGFIDGLMQHPPHRVEGTAVFLTAHVDYLPVSFLHNLKHNHVMHERVFFLKVSIWDVPYVKDEERITLRDLGNGIYVVRAVYGFNETPDMGHIIELIEKQFSCPIYPLLKREDEKWVTEMAYENPKFVEDLARDVAVALDKLGIERYKISSTADESIHHHEAEAFVSKDWILG
jgi:KUP system potassium uptake protein